MRVLVTGSNGLIGGEICRSLSSGNSKADIRVIGVDKPDKIAKSPSVITSNALSTSARDITHPDFRSFLDEVRPDAIIHCAAHPGGLSGKEPTENVLVNAYGSMQIFEWCSRNKAKVIFLSSSAIYGDRQTPEELTEQAELKPSTIYAINKLACEKYLTVLEKTYSLRWTVFRLFATYGFGHELNTYQGIVNVFYTQLLNSTEVEVKGSLERKRGILYIRDVAPPILKALQQKETDSQIYNLSGESITIREIIYQIGKTLGIAKEKLVIKESPGTVGDTFYNLANCKKVRTELGFDPLYSIEMGLADMHRSYLEKA